MLSTPWLIQNLGHCRRTQMLPVLKHPDDLLVRGDLNQLRAAIRGALLNA